MIDELKVQVQYYGSIRAVSEKRDEEVVLSPNTTVYGLLQNLAGSYGEHFRDEIFKAGGEDLRDDLTVTVNGTIIDHPSVNGVILKPGDEIALFPVFPGGG